MSAPGDLVAALTSVIQAVGDGVLSPEEGELIATLVNAQRQALELVELEQRIAALEAKRNA